MSNFQVVSRYVILKNQNVYADDSTDNILYSQIFLAILKFISFVQNQICFMFGLSYVIDKLPNDIYIQNKKCFMVFLELRYQHFLPKDMTTKYIMSK